jgi:hypothetical protein
LPAFILYLLNRKKIFLQTAFLFLLIFSAAPVCAQIKVSGTVYDSSRIYPLEQVSVLSSSGRGTVTDANGNYQIEVGEKDSIWFSYLNKGTLKYPVSKMLTPWKFDLALHVNIPVLTEIRIKPRDYRMDSIQNRLDYKKAFDFHKPTVGSMTSIGPMGAGIDINELIRAFQFRKNKSMLSFQQRLLNEEQEKFVDYRFSKRLVRQLTGLEGAQLDSFMVHYRPPYDFTLYASDYNFRLYIKNSLNLYLRKEIPAIKQF